MFRLPKDTELTIEILDYFIGKHREEVTDRYEMRDKEYKSEHDILTWPKKPAYKPDNRIVVNFHKYIVDTTNGFFIGNPIKYGADDEAVSDYVQFLNKYNSQDDKDAELSKLCCKFGKGFEMYYPDEEAVPCTTFLTPLEAFMIYDDSIIEREMYFVRRYTDWKGNEFGSVSNNWGVRHFTITGGTRWTDEWTPHHFDGVPATEFIENEERQSVTEPILTMAAAYNKALSEKANDVDYFADAYMKIFGPKLDGEEIRYIRDTRIINFDGEDAEKIIAEFMDKPSNDAAQENLLDRLERHIFTFGMVPDISDENFGTDSGIAMLYKMWSTSNRGKTKERKFTAGLNRRYKLLFSYPTSKVPADSWVQLDYTFTPNIPANVKEEVEIAQGLEGIASRHTQLKVLSVVDNVQDELDVIEEENKPDENDPVMNTMFGVADTLKATETEEVVNDEQP